MLDARRKEVKLLISRMREVSQNMELTSAKIIGTPRHRHIHMHTMDPAWLMASSDFPDWLRAGSRLVRPIQE